MSVVSSLVNGLTGMMAILYGEGDYLKTVGITLHWIRLTIKRRPLGFDRCCGMSGIGEEAVGLMTTMPKWYDWDKPSMTCT